MVRLSSGQARRLRALASAVAVVAAAAGLLELGLHADALRAAGLDGGKAIEHVDSFVTSLTDHVKWLGVTLVGFSIALIGLLFLMGHSRAQDIALKVGAGAFLLVAAHGIAQ